MQKFRRSARTKRRPISFGGRSRKSIGRSGRLFRVTAGLSGPKAGVPGLRNAFRRCIAEARGKDPRALETTHCQPSREGNHRRYAGRGPRGAAAGFTIQASVKPQPQRWSGYDGSPGSRATGLPRAREVMVMGSSFKPARRDPAPPGDIVRGLVAFREGRRVSRFLPRWVSRPTTSRPTAS